MLGIVGQLVVGRRRDLMVHAMRDLRASVQSNGVSTNADGIGGNPRPTPTVLTSGVRLG